MPPPWWHPRGRAGMLRAAVRTPSAIVVCLGALAGCHPLTLPPDGGGTGATAPAVEVSVGQNHVCTVLADGATWCWGRWLGIGSPDAGRAIRRITDLSAHEVMCAEDFTCARTDTDALRCWGANSLSMLGDDSTATAVDPVVPPLPEPLTSLSSFGYHSCGATAGGQVSCWGSSAYGECGVSASTVRTPSPVAGISGVVALRAGSRSTWVVLGDGGVSLWGYDLLAVNDSAPTHFPLSEAATAVTANIAHACALLRSGRVECWGRVREGALGFDGGTDLYSQGVVTGLSGALTVCAGKAHSCASFGDGGVACWGDNTWGQLGTGNYAPSLGPVPVQSLPEASSVACGDKVSCAVTTDGVYCWGDNQEQQLGSVTPPGTTRPLRVPLP
jgi:alpha-tubulin suppressor-like RCC1 family protein